MLKASSSSLRQSQVSWILLCIACLSRREGRAQVEADIYRLNDAYTFRETLRLKESIHRIKDPPEDVKIPLVLVGSKSLPPFGVSRSRRIFG